MKKFVLLVISISLSFGNNIFACKSEKLIWEVVDAQDRHSIAKSLMQDGKCKILSEYRIVSKVGVINVVSYGGEHWYTPKGSLK